MKTFTERFLNVLIDEQDITTDDELASADAEAAANQLDPGTDPSMLDVEPGPAGGAIVPNPGDNPASEMQKAQNIEYASKITGWVDDVEGFIDYLNGLGENSLNSQINSAPCDTIFDEISRSETKKIGRIAQDLRSLSEALKSYLISND
tara:strand:- start:167 stop:613 length:447 start_codon:yes stop_codon:yes gene_type:complete